MQHVSSDFLEIDRKERAKIPSDDVPVRPPEERILDFNEVIIAIDEEIQQVQETPPTQKAVDRAVKQARALFAYGSESITNQAFWMGFTEMFDSYDWFTGYLDRLATVTTDDVQRIARTYLRPQNRILGTYLPANNGKEQA